MDADQWPLGLDVLNKHVEAPKAAVIERKPRPQKEQALNCPRCNSTNTKFCYYNNYNLSQPRYFCKTCRRYWTEGGTLRNVPVGGGSRKNKRSSSSSSSSSSTSSVSVLKKLPDLTSSTGLITTNTASQNPKIHGGQDLNLAFDHNLPDHHRVYNASSFGEGKGTGQHGGFEFDHHNPNLMASSLELFKESGGGLNVSSRGLGLSFLGSMHLSDHANNTMNIINNPTLIASHSNDYFKPRFNFCLDGQLDHMGNYGNTIMQVQQQQQQQQQQPAGGILQETNGTRPFHPYDDHSSKQFATSISDHQYEQQNKGQGESSGGGCWSGMLGGGSW